MPIKATDNEDGTYALQFSAELTVNPTNLNLEATQADVLTAVEAILAKIIAAPATAAKQDTAQTSLTAIAAALGATSDAAWTSGDGSVIAILKTIATNTAPT